MTESRRQARAEQITFMTRTLRVLEADLDEARTLGRQQAWRQAFDHRGNCVLEALREGWEEQALRDLIAAA